MEDIKVAIRVRPLLEKEKKLPIQWQVNGNSIFQVGSQMPSYTFDHIFDTHECNIDIFRAIVQPMIASSVEGYNSTVFTYGQTSSGKTHTMLGCDNDWGIIPLTIKNIFESINNIPDRKFLLRLSYIEIYNDFISDLLNRSSKPIKILDDPSGTVRMNNVVETIIHTVEEGYNIIKDGEKCRRYASTNVNQRSSRSHTILRIVIESTSVSDCPDSDALVHVSHLNLVDLAGSERASQTKATGQRLREGGHINKSLYHLSTVINQLSEGNGFISFRDSKLTRILKESLGGNARTLIIGTITPVSIEESASTLFFISQAKKIKNKPIINEVADSEALIKQYIQKEKILRQQLAEMAEDKKELEEKHHRTIKDLTEQIDKLKKQFVTSSKTIPKDEQKRRHTVGYSSMQSKCENYRIFTDELKGMFESSQLQMKKESLPILSEESTPRNASKFNATDVSARKIVQSNVQELDPLEILYEKLQSLILVDNESENEENQKTMVTEGLQEIYDTFCNSNSKFNQPKLAIPIVAKQNNCSNCRTRQKSQGPTDCNHQNVLPFNESSTNDSENETNASENSNFVLEKEETKSVNCLNMSNTTKFSLVRPQKMETFKDNTKIDANNSTLYSEQSNCNECKVLQEENANLKVEVKRLKESLEVIQDERVLLKSKLAETSNLLECTEDKLLSVTEQLDSEEKEKLNLQKKTTATINQLKTLYEALQLENNMLKQQLTDIENNITNCSADTDVQTELNVNDLTQPILIESEKIAKDCEELETDFFQENKNEIKPFLPKLEQLEENIEMCKDHLVCSDDESAYKHLNHSTNSEEDITVTINLLKRLENVLLVNTLNDTVTQVENRVVTPQKVLNNSQVEHTNKSQLEVDVIEQNRINTELAESIIALQNKIAEQNQQNTELLEKIKLLENLDADSLQTHITLIENKNVLNHKISKQEQINNKLIEENNALNYEIQQRTQMFENLNKETVSLQNKLIQQKLGHEKLIQATTTIENKISEYEKVNTSLVEEKNTLQCKIIEIENQNLKLIEESTTLKDEIMKQQQSFEKLTEEVNLLHSMLTQQENKNTNLNKDREMLHKKIMEQDNEIANLEKEIKFFKNKVTRYSKENANLIEKKDILQCKYTEQKEICIKLIKEVSALKEKCKQQQKTCETLNTEIAFLKKKSEHTPCVVNHQSPATRKILGNINESKQNSATAKDLNASNNFNKKRNMWWQVDKKKLESEIEHLDNEIIVTVDYMHDLEEIIKCKNKKIDELTSTELKRRRSAAHDASRNLEGILNEEEQSSCPRCKIVNSSELNRALERQLRRKNMEVAQLEKSLRRIQLDSAVISDENKDLSEQLEYYKQHVDKQEKEVTKLLQETEDLKRKNNKCQCGLLGYEIPELMKGPLIPVEYYNNLMLEYRQTKNIAESCKLELKNYQVPKVCRNTQTETIHHSA